jgi:hypothetical protein
MCARHPVRFTAFNVARLHAKRLLVAQTFVHLEATIASLIGMQSTTLRARPSLFLRSRDSLFPLLLFLSFAFLAFSGTGLGDVIAPGPHKVEKRIEGTLIGGPVQVQLKNETGTYWLYFSGNTQLEELAQKLLGKRVVVKGFPKVAWSGVRESDIEVTSLVQAD